MRFKDIFDKLFDSSGENREMKNFRDKFLDVYVDIHNRNQISEYAQKYRNETWSVFDPFKKVYGAIFTVGYFTREAELTFKNSNNKDAKNLQHNSETNKILNSNVSNEEKILKIAEYKEMNNYTIGIGPEVEEYSILGLSQSQRCLDWMVRFYMNNVIGKELSKLQYDKELYTELVYRNAAFGYCFRLAEEIVFNNSSPTNVTSPKV